MSDNDKGLLEQYAEAEADQRMLQVLWEGLAQDKNTTVFDGPIRRSIMRAEREAVAVRQEYEQGVIS